MKIVLLFLFFGWSFSGFSQLTDTLEAEKFWSDNIQNIVSFNKEKILAQTHFPIKVGEKFMTRKQFEPIIEQLFSQELRNELAEQTIENIDAWVMFDDTTPTYMIVCFEGIGNHESVQFNFFQYEEKWMLNGVTYFERED